MRRVLLLSALILSLITTALAATANFITLPATTHSYTGGDSGHEGAYGIDENFSTYHGVELNSIYVNAITTCISQHIFDQPRNVVSIRYRLYSYASQSYNGGTSYTVRVEYTLNGSSWSTVPDTGVTGTSNGGEGGSSHTYNSGDVTKTVNITNCLGIRAYVYSLGHSEDGWTYSYSRIYEIEALGTAYKDIGIRIQGPNGIIKIGAEDLTPTHKLRIRKGDTTYGIPLLTTNDPDASPVRIYDGSSVKALPKVSE